VPSATSVPRIVACGVIASQDAIRHEAGIHPSTTTEVRMRLLVATYCAIPQYAAARAASPHPHRITDDRAINAHSLIHPSTRKIRGVPLDDTVRQYTIPFTPRAGTTLIKHIRRDRQNPAVCQCETAQ